MLGVNTPQIRGLEELLKGSLVFEGEMAIYKEKADSQIVQGFASYVKI